MRACDPVGESGRLSTSSLRDIAPPLAVYFKTLDWILIDRPTLLAISDATEAFVGITLSRHEAIASAQ
jgi:hypothetical protein